MMGKRLLGTGLVLCLLLSLLCGCGGGTENAQVSGDVSSEASPTPTEAASPEQEVNPLTGLPAEPAQTNDRPVAIMLNNIKIALPQYGVSKADLIYEVAAEGGITRMVAVFQNTDGLGQIGTVRSTRLYYLDIVQGLDAILLHAGGSAEAYQAIKTRDIQALDCVNGPYMGSLFWRDKDRIKNAGYEHSVFTSGEKIREVFDTLDIRKEHESGYQLPLTFADDGTPKDGTDAAEISIQFSNYKTGVFTYDSESGQYLVQEYGKNYIDGETNEQVGMQNVLILRTDISRISGDTAGRLKVNLTGSGSGQYACNGKIQTIIWSKNGPESPFVYTYEDGSPVVFQKGTSYINIISETNDVTVTNA